jgi:CHAT domain-containing protein
MKSAIFLARDEGRSAEVGDLSTDGEITADQTVNSWDLDADLVVLSACETGLGRYADGEGYLGFAPELFAKAARRLMLSLWKAPTNRPPC